MVMPGKPLFVPDWSDSWSITPSLAFRLCRLGKSIGRRFANRYYDAVIPIALMRAAALENRPGMDGFAMAFDGAIAIGETIQLSPSGNYRLNIGQATLTLDSQKIDIDNVIATISQFMTLQMGDLLLPCIPAMSIQVKPGENICGSLNETSAALNIKLK